MNDWIRTDPATADAATWGGKGAALARLVALGLPVPPLAVVTPAAVEASLTETHRAALDAASRGDLAPDALADLLADLAPSREFVAAIGEALGALGRPARLAVRSSAPDEDGAAHAFAGQLESFLGVAPADVPARVADVWRSAFAPRVWAYRVARGIDGPPAPPAVVLQGVIEARAAGVAFTADPVTGTDVCVIAAVHGLATSLVDGRESGETLHVDTDGLVVHRTDGGQATADRLGPDGEGLAEHPAPAGPVLTDDEAARVAALARRAAASLGGPQDVEWALDAEGTLWLVQSRPITTLGTGESGTGNERGEIVSSPFPMPHSPSLRLWDNSNIAESYGGVTSPLTYSFARRAYEAVYREFCRLLGVPEARVAAEADTFAAMIGRIHGRVYYNLGNWYRVLALLPGYRLNASLMEGMMGVREPIPDALRPAPAPVSKLGDAFALARSVAGLVGAAVRLPAMQRAFYVRLDETLAPVDLDAMPLDALADHYRDVERRLLTRWDAPLVNDFFAMIAFGVAGRLAERWIGPGALGGLLAGDGGVISAEPAARVGAMSRLAADGGLVDVLQHGTLGEIERAVAAHPDLAAMAADYLDRFGDRCLEELKLESPTLADDPLPLWRSVGTAASHPDRAGDRAGATVTLRADAEARRTEALRGHPLRRVVFGAVLQRARARVRDRENLRFERTRVFGRARRIVRAMGARLVEAGRLATADDVFYLDLGELLGACDGTAAGTDLVALAAARRAETDAWRAAPPPPDRFTTTGAVVLAPLVPTIPSASGEASRAEASGEVRIGVGCCPGVVEGPARVVRDPRGVSLAPGTILVAERTDPGWVLLFPACAGLVVERGSLLSHSAIVARELGLPAAVAVPGATAWLQDGDRVRLDGATGRVERIAP